MNATAASFFGRLEVILKEEIDLQIQYAAVLEEENSLVAKFKPQDIAPITEKRQIICEAIAELQAKRVALTSEIPEAHGKRLSQVVQQIGSKRESDRILKLIDKLKILVHSNQRRSGEFSRLVNFALTIVNGSISLLWSATQSVAKAYGRNRVVKESYVPKTREHSTLEEA